MTKESVVKYVVDKSDKPVIDKEKSLIELATYVGFDVGGLEKGEE